MDMTLRNCTLDALRSYIYHSPVVPNNVLVTKVFKDTPPGSKLSTLLVDIFACYTNCSFSANPKHDYPTSFYRMLLDRVVPAAKGTSVLQNPYTAPKCTYHEHDASCPPCE